MLLGNALFACDRRVEIFVIFASVLGSAITLTDKQDPSLGTQLTPQGGPKSKYMFFVCFESQGEEQACLITLALHSNFEIFQKWHPAVEFMIDRRIFER